MIDLQTLSQGIPPDVYPSEASYYAAWLNHAQVSGDPLSDPLRMALRGGLLSGNRFAWIFCAGYQAAIRHVFDTCEFSGWGAFAVSEDRNDVTPLPGVTGLMQGDQIQLKGHKTWVAASDHVQDLIISARIDSATSFLTVARDLPGLTITTKPKGRVLPDLSQGIAHFDAALVPRSAILPKAGAKYFGPAEVLYIYAAFLASTWRELATRRGQIEKCLPLLQSCSQNVQLSREGEMHQLDAQVQALLQSLRDNEYSADEQWRKEYKLVAMYSKQ